MKLLNNVILAAIGIIAVFAFIGYPEPSRLTTLVLALTAVAVLWYGKETAMLRAEMARQNKLQTRPAIIPDLADKKIYLKNEGLGPGLNVKLKEYEPFSAVQNGAESVSKESGRCYRMTPMAFLPSGSKAELKIFCDDLKAGTKGTVPDCGACFQEEKLVRLTIGYEDIEGTVYQSRIMIKNGTCINIKFEEIKD